MCGVFFFVNDTATTEIYTLSLHDALPISRPARHHPRPPAALRAPLRLHRRRDRRRRVALRRGRALASVPREGTDRKSTRLNSSHANISYAVFCLKKKNKILTHIYDEIIRN